MNLLSNKFPTKELQMRDAAHHMHPFTAQAELGEKGARIITPVSYTHLTLPTSDLV